MLQSAADFSITMLAGGKHTAIKEGAAPYNYDLKVLDKSEFILLPFQCFSVGKGRQAVLSLKSTVEGTNGGKTRQICNLRNGIISVAQEGLRLRQPQGIDILPEIHTDPAAEYMGHAAAADPKAFRHRFHGQLLPVMVGAKLQDALDIAMG